MLGCAYNVSLLREMLYREKGILQNTCSLFDVREMIIICRLGESYRSIEKLRKLNFISKPVVGFYSLYIFIIGLAKKFIRVFPYYVTKTRTNFLANPIILEII